MINTLLIFFALPVAVIIFSIALQKIFNNPLLVAAIIFAIFLVVTFIIGNLIFLVATIAYTLLAFITAILTQIICKILTKIEDCDDNNSSNVNDDVLTINDNWTTENLNTGRGKYCRNYR